MINNRALGRRGAGVGRGRGGRGVGAGRTQERYGAGAQPCLSCSYCDGARGIHCKLLEEIDDVTLREDVLEGTDISALLELGCSPHQLFLHRPDGSRYCHSHAPILSPFGNQRESLSFQC